MEVGEDLDRWLVGDRREEKRRDGLDVRGCCVGPTRGRGGLSLGLTLGVLGPFWCFVEREGGGRGRYVGVVVEWAQVMKMDAMPSYDD